MISHDTIPQPIASPAPQRRSIKKKVVQQPSGTFTPFTSPSTGRRRKDIGDYWLGHTLGKGSSGTLVTRALDHRTKRLTTSAQVVLSLASTKKLAKRWL